MDTIANSVSSAMDIGKGITKAFTRLSTLERDIKTAGDEAQKNLSYITTISDTNAKRYAKVMERLGALEEKSRSLENEVNRLRDAN